MGIKKLFSSFLVGSVLLGLLAAPAIAAPVRVYVNVPPPPVRVEVRGTAPGPGFVWIRGYHRWDGGTYVWVPGRWDKRPRARAAWVSGRWVKHHRGWYWTEGHWR